jgi:hypothetical protein
MVPSGRQMNVLTLPLQNIFTAGAALLQYVTSSQDYVKQAAPGIELGQFRGGFTTGRITS